MIVIFVIMIQSFKIPQTAPLRIFLKEIKLRLMYSFLGSLFAFYVSYLYSEDLLYWIIQPNNQIQSHFIFLNISEALYTTLKISGLTTLCTCIPLWWYHVWSFLIPSCTTTERKKFTQVSVLFLLFFVLSIWWTFYIGTPLLAKFLLQFQIQKSSFIVEYQATLYSYISWVWSCLLTMFIVSQFPTLLVITVISKRITPQAITQYRKAILIGSVLIAAFISPPDIIVQMVLALSLYIYIEFIIWCLFMYTSTNVK